MAFSLLFVAVWELGCDRQQAGGIHQLGFYPDTVRFDSVYAGRVSGTKLLCVRNEGADVVRLDRVWLAEADDQYAMLVDGQSTGKLAGYELRSGDSLLVAVRVQPRVGGTDTVLALRNRVCFSAGGEERSVQMRAAGLGVRMLGMDTLRTDWHLDGPPARMVPRTLYVPRGVTLRISGNSALYFSAGAGLVVDGSLVVEGSAARPVVLAGDRLETYYRRKPGQWLGIHLRSGSGPHALRWLEVRSAVCGVRADSLAGGEPLVVEHARLLYNSLEGMDVGYSRLVLRSSLLAQNYRHGIRLRNAEAEVTHCTLYGASSPPQVRTGSLLAVQHDAGMPLPSFRVVNSIVWGDRESEIEPALRAEYADRFVLQYSLARVRARDTVRLSSWRYIQLEAPLFDAKGHEHFLLSAKSPARGRALRAVSLVDSVDLRGLNRLNRAGNADLGAFEYSDR